jgi:hypothetical protein
MSMSSIAGSSHSTAAMAESSEPAKQSLLTRSVPGSDRVDEEKASAEEFGTSSGGALEASLATPPGGGVAKDASKEQLVGAGKGIIDIASSDKDPLSDRSLSQQPHTHSSKVSGSLSRHGSGASDAAAEAAELQDASSAPAEDSPRHSQSSAHPEVSIPQAGSAAMRRDLPLPTDAAAKVADTGMQTAVSEDPSTSVIAVDLNGQAVQRSAVTVDSNSDVDVDDGIADSGPRVDQVNAVAASTAAGEHAGSLESDVREFVIALEGQLEANGTLEGILHGAGDREGNSGVVLSDKVHVADRSESIGSTSGMDGGAGSSRVSQDLIEVSGHARVLY